MGKPKKKITKYHSKILAVAFFIALITYLVYLPALQNDFVDWDDDAYVYENLNIRSPGFKSIKWMFTAFHASNWHPLTWLSHSIDYALWGLNPLGHHLTSVVLHGINSFLVVILMAVLIGIAEKIRNPKSEIRNKLIAAGITGLLFGLHPVHVESVAWVSERKDVLYSFFYLLGILTYVRYIKELYASSGYGKTLTGPLNRYYILSLVFFAFSIMSKPMAVTLPFVLLILDWYPFARFRHGSFTRVFSEKVPFFLLSLGSGVITIMAQRTGAIKSLDLIPLSSRIPVALKAVIDYLFKMIYPVNLSPYYPHPQINKVIELASFKYFVSLILIAGITTACIVVLRNRKLFMTVWAYYLVSLLPVLGIIQVGSQAMADRYAYLPSLGPFMLFGLGAAWIIDRRSAQRMHDILKKSLLVSMAVLLFAVLSYMTVIQIRIWKNAETLWSRTIDLYPDATLGYNNRGVYYRSTGEYEKAITDFTNGISIKADSVLLYTNRARAFAGQGRFENALNDANEAVSLQPDDWMTYMVRGKVYAMFERNKEALKDYNEAIRLNSHLPDVYNNRGNIYVKLGLLEEAVSDYSQAIDRSTEPRAAYYHNLSIVYKMLGQPENAMLNFRKYEKIKSNR